MSPDEADPVAAETVAPPPVAVTPSATGLVVGSDDLEDEPSEPDSPS